MHGALRLLCLGWALLPALAHPVGRGGRNHSSDWHHLGPEPPLEDAEVVRRCADETGFDAVTLDEGGTMLFFKGDLVWKGFTGRAEPINASWPDVGGPVDAALRIHHVARQDLHDNVYLFRGERLWAYAQGKLRPGYPRLIGEEFKGVPSNLDAAVECHPKECQAETILFFKGANVFSYDLQTGQVKLRSWPAISHCTAAVRWLDHYYCFQNIHFLRFNPVTGEVPPNYSRDARDYFMRCPGRGHGHAARHNATVWALLNRCSGHPFQAFSSDDSGRTYAFRGGRYFRLDSARDGWHAWPLNHTWKGLEGEVDAAFSWEDKLYLIQGPQVVIYQAGPGYARIEGYPRALQQELGVGGADAAFTCPQSHEAYIIQGSHIRHVDLRTSPRLPGPPQPIPHDKVDSALCTRTGVSLFHGADFHHYDNVAQLVAAKAPSPAQNIAAVFFQCPKAGAGRAAPHPPHHG
ncbi:hemopexin isoform X2 [Varanus komodoensis]|uniref:hemopexin isoform X2 n=1 Tax=Varanus komodoensis TaxID=61221 RepID=UPI001CF7A362|nr:hemopexin isoform X2 [Varanus komodoensis]